MDSGYAANDPVSFDYGVTNLTSPCLLDPEDEEDNVEALAVYYSDVTAVNVPGEVASVLPYGVTCSVDPNTVTSATWELINTPEDSTATIDPTMGSQTVLAVPEIGGFYDVRVTIGSEDTLLRVWLPTAGPDISQYWQSEIDYFRNTWGPNGLIA